MANIAPLPNGQDLLTSIRAKGRPVGYSAQFGPHARVVFDSTGLSLQARSGEVMAQTHGSDYSVDLDRVDSAGKDLVPYVNKFIAGWGKVETYWRTGSLRLKSATGTTTKPSAGFLAPSMPVAPAQVQQAVAAAVAPTPAPVAPVPDPEPEQVADPEPEVLFAAPASKPKPAPKHGAGKAPVHKTIGGDKVVIYDTGIIVPADFHSDLTDAWATVEAGGLAAVCITGPSGTAKTMSVRAFADSIGVDLVTVQGVAIETASDWFGQFILLDGKTEFVLSPFGEALRDGKRCVVLLDEANRAASAAAMNAVMSLTDGQREVYVPGYGTLTRPDGMLIVITANLGAEYVGTVPFDAAVRQRFNYGPVLNYPNEAVEVEVLRTVAGIDKDSAGRLVRMANQQRPLKDDLTQFPSGTGVSPRMLVEVAKRHVQRGTPLRAALTSMFGAQFDREDHKALTNILDQHFPSEANATLDVDTDEVHEAGF